MRCQAASACEIIQLKNFLVLEDSAPEPPHVIDQSPAANFVDRKSAGILEACAYTARCSSPIDPEITIHNRDRFLVPQ